MEVHLLIREFLYIEGVAESYARRIEDVKPLEDKFSQEDYDD